MPITYVDYTATAAQTDFAFSFPYLEDEHVIVQIDGSATTDFTIVTTPSTKIVLNVGATAGQIVRVSRVSQPDQNLVDFVNGSVLTESELDRAYLHNRYLAEESAEQNDVSLRVKEGAAGWDGLNKRLLNLANPVDDQDAATKDYVDDVVGSVAVGTLPDDSVTYAKIQEVAANNVLLGNDNGTNQNIQELTAAEVRTVLNVADGATANTGTVTSVASGTGLTGGPITTSGTLSLASINNLNVLGNVSGSAAAPTSVEIKDEDAMTSDSATALATQQSIKAYVDSQTVSKYSTGWVNTDGSTSVANAALLTFTHNLSTDDFTVAVYASANSNGSDPFLISPTDTNPNTFRAGAQVVATSTTQVSVQLGATGYMAFDSSGDASTTVSWTSKYIKVVVIG